MLNALNKGAGSEASLPVTLRIRRCAPSLLHPPLAHCRAKWARPSISHFLFYNATFEMQGFRHCGGDAEFASRPLAPFDVHSPCFLFFPAACPFLRQADSHRWTQWGIGAVAAASGILPAHAFRRIPANFLPLNQPASCRPPLGLRTAKSPSLSAKFYQTTCQTYPSMIKFCQKETSCAKCARFTRREIF